MKIKSSVMILVLAQCLAASALADCVYQGRTYHTGEKVRGLTCQANGTWA